MLREQPGGTTVSEDPCTTTARNRYRVAKIEVFGNAVQGRRRDGADRTRGWDPRVGVDLSETEACGGGVGL